MTLIDGTSGFLPRFMWCGRADIPECPAPRSKTSGAPSYSFGAVLKAADMTSVRPGSARCGIAQPRPTLTGQRRYTDEREWPSKRLGLMQGSYRATSRSGGGYGLWPATALQQASPHCRRNLGNPCAEKVLQHRPRQNNAPPLGRHRQGMLTITGSNVRLGTEMPVALPSFSK